MIYMHDKGSQHDWGGNNTHLRHFMMRAVTSTTCHNMPDYCNTCGASFSPLPYPAYHGNFWVARCSYIQKLIPVTELSEKLKEFYDEIKKLDLLLKEWAKRYPLGSHV